MKWKTKNASNFRVNVRDNTADRVGNVLGREPESILRRYHITRRRTQLRADNRSTVRHACTFT